MPPSVGGTFFFDVNVVTKDFKFRYKVTQNYCGQSELSKILRCLPQINK